MSDAKMRVMQRKIQDEIQSNIAAIQRRIDVKEHAKIVRKELKKEFPNIKFWVRSSRFSGGNSVDVYHVGDITCEQEQQIKAFVKKFDGHRGDLLDNCYNVGFLHNGERIQGASFCTYNGSINLCPK